MDMDSGEQDVGQFPGGLDSSAVRLKSNLDDPDDWNYVDTQHASLSHTCEEAEPLLGATLVSHAVSSSRKRRHRETQEAPCRVSSACGTRGEAKVVGTARHQPFFCRAATEEQGHTHRRELR